MRFHYGMAPGELEKAAIDRATLRRAWQFARPYRSRLLLYCLIIIGSTFLALLPPLVFKQLLDTVVKHRFDLSFDGRLMVFFGEAVVLAVAMTSVQLVSRWLGSGIGEGLIFDMRLALYEKVQRMPIAFFTRTQTGALLSRLSNDVIGAQSTVTTAATVFSDVLTLVSVLGMMLFLSWKVTLLALFVVPVFVTLDRLLGKRLAAMSRRRMTLNSDMSSTMTERFNVAGALLVKLFGRPKAELATFADRAAAVRDTGVKIAVLGRIYYGMLALAGAFGTAAVYWFGGRAVLRGTISVGTLSALAAYVTRLYSPLTDLASARTDLLTALVSFDRCFEVIDAPEAIVEKPDAVVLTRPGGHVAVEQVTFRYPAPSAVSVASLEAGSPDSLSDEPGDIVLHDVSFTAEPGHTIALVGPSGAGKTTLTSLIPRLYDVTEGSVRIDGIDVRDITLQSLSDAVGVVSQDPHLFHDTIVANLRYARPEATDAEIVEACRAARIHDVIVSLPEAYETVVGERGHRLSGGEKQRLSIARVLLKQPSVVILDEATSHLDSENEAAIQAALSEALSGRTAIVIAHRLSTIVAADQILVLQDGRLVQRGTHGELLDRGGLYRELFETQFATT
jgi:ATP-binding cassette subfamily B protein